MPIHPGAAIGAVHLTVSDLEQSVRFYEERIGLRRAWLHDDSAGLGAGGADLLVLHESKGAPHVRRTTGLYHFAILVPSRLHLAWSLRHFADTQTQMTGFSDHGVSEALYLDDPDGIGIEVYRDRPRDEWPQVNGQLQMKSEPLEVESLLRDADVDWRRTGASWTGLPSGTFIGHVHLHVSFIEDAERFYREVMGFDLTGRYGGSASFFAAGGYHHHVAANTWAGVGAPQPPEGAIGLKHFEILLPDSTSVADVGRRIQSAGLGADTADGRVTVRDPSGNQIVVTTRPG